MSNISRNLGESGPNCVNVPEVAGENRFKICLVYIFFSQTITHQIFPGRLYLDKAVQCPVKGK